MRTISFSSILTNSVQLTFALLSRKVTPFSQPSSSDKFAVIHLNDEMTQHVNVLVVFLNIIGIYAERVTVLIKLARD
jgi:hypothetical protein